MTRRHYSREFKEEAVGLALQGELPKIQVARNLGITEKLLHTWIHQYGPPKAGEPPRLAEEERAELHRLRRDNLRLQQERDILKKALGIFSEAQR